MSDFTEEVSFLDVTKKIEDLKKVKASLLKEINQNQMDAQNVREAIVALQSKIEDLKKQIASLDSLIVKRHEELAGLDSKSAKEMAMIEANKRDLISLRESVNSEQFLFQKEKEMYLHQLNEERKKLARIEITLNSKEEEIKNKERELSGGFQELDKRKAHIESLEIKITSKLSEADLKNKESEDLLRKNKKSNDEIEAIKVSYDSKLNEIKHKTSEFEEKESHIKTCYNDIELRKKELDDREREIVISEDRVRSLKARLYKEIQVSSITEKRKQEYKKELN